jgi:ketol-acid reductoisomerase
MEEALNCIRSGQFAQEWKQEEFAGYPNFKRLREEAFAHPLNDTDRSVRSLLQEASEPLA